MVKTNLLHRLLGGLAHFIICRLQLQHCKLFI